MFSMRVSSNPTGEGRALLSPPPLNVAWQARGQQGRIVQVDAGIADDLVLGDPTAPRFVYWENKLRATPSGPVSAVFGDFLSFPGKIRAGLGAVGLFNEKPPGKEESVKEFISRNLGPEVFFRLIEPFCSGVYAGNPERLSMKAAFGRIQVRATAAIRVHAGICGACV